VTFPEHLAESRLGHLRYSFPCARTYFLVRRGFLGFFSLPVFGLSHGVSSSCDADLDGGRSSAARRSCRRDLRAFFFSSAFGLIDLHAEPSPSSISRLARKLLSVLFRLRFVAFLLPLVEQTRPSTVRGRASFPFLHGCLAISLSTSINVFAALHLAFISFEKSFASHCAQTFALRAHLTVVLALSSSVFLQNSFVQGYTVFLFFSPFVSSPPLSSA